MGEQIPIERKHLEARGAIFLSQTVIMSFGKCLIYEINGKKALYQPQVKLTFDYNEQEVQNAIQKEKEKNTARNSRWNHFTQKTIATKSTY